MLTPLNKDSFSWHVQRLMEELASCLCKKWCILYRPLGGPMWSGVATHIFGELKNAYSNKDD